jgi:photosystem II stability/assembly factor-like uncharacterized protein
MKTKRLFGFLFLGAMLVLAGCGGQVATEPPQGKVIFLADPPEVQMGNCTILVWDASSAFEVRLDGELVTLGGNREVCPTETTIYVLEADLGTSVERRELEVRVMGAGEEPEVGIEPELQEQAGSPAPVAPGTPAYQAEAWVALGNPPGDLGYDIRYNFANHDIWYVTDGNAGFHISTDRGLTWKPSNSGISTFEGSSNMPVFSATVDPHNPNTIWIGTQNTGHIYKSTDGGANWIEMDNGVEPNTGLHFRGFTVDPRSSDIVYAMAEVETYVFTDAGKPVPYPDSPCQGGRIYRTTDGGKNWSLIWEGEALARYLWIDPTNPDVLYASTGIFDRCPLNMPPGAENAWEAGGVGVLKSTDGGKTWTSLGKANGLDMLHVGSLYMKPDDPQTLLAGTGAKIGNLDKPSGIVYLTRDGGETWQAVVTGDITIGAVEYCEQNPRVAYAAGETAVYRSEDGGLTWETYTDKTRGTWGPPGLYPAVPIDLQIDPDSPDCDRLFINNYIGANFLSTDGGKTWATATDGYSGASVLGLAVSSRDPNLVYAGVRMAMFVSEDGGEKWESISNPELVAGVLTLALDPSDDRHLLLVEGENQTIFPPVYESYDGGATWKRVFFLAPPAGTPEIAWGRMKFYEIAFAPSDPKIVYAATLNPPIIFETQVESDYIIGTGVYRSNDGGTTWAPANDDSIANLGFASIAVHPNDPQTVYAGTYGGGFYKTTNGGSSWTLLQSGLPTGFSIFRAIAIDPRNPETVLAGGKGGLFISTDGGGTWKQVTAGFPPEESVTAILIDPTHEGVIYLGTVRGGVLYSTDGGQNFHPLAQGLDLTVGNLTILKLGLSPDGSVLYAGTRGQGVYRLGTSVATQP